MAVGVEFIVLPCLALVDGLSGVTVGRNPWKNPWAIAEKF
jgi:hypothetical protein